MGVLGSRVGDFSAFMAALSGDKGLRKAYDSFFGEAKDASSALADYRLYVLGKGEGSKRAGGTLPVHELLWLRMRHLRQV